MPRKDLLYHEQQHGRRDTDPKIPNLWSVSEMVCLGSEGDCTMIRDCHREGSIRLMNRFEGASATIYGIYKNQLAQCEKTIVSKIHSRLSL